MTPKQVINLMRAAVEGTPHEPGAIEQAEWYIRYMDRDTLKEAGNCYEAIVGELTLPANFGKAPSRSHARREIENRRDQG